MAVEIFWNDAIRLHALWRGLSPQVIVRRMAEKSVGQTLDAFLHAVTEVLAHAAALLHGVLVVLFEQAMAGIGESVRKTCAMNEPVQCRKVIKALFHNNALQIELDVGLPSYECAVAQQAQRGAVGHNTPKMLGAVEILLHE
ncbi:MAG: hypothetical protein HBSIN02_06280 [Bacteroidia bacterium]|nr:MAG: hypothetical protein HBSIN02_06280 [Bacteroidia bacterium]